MKGYIVVIFLLIAINFSPLSRFACRTYLVLRQISSYQIEKMSSCDFILNKNKDNWLLCHRNDWNATTEALFYNPVYYLSNHGSLLSGKSQKRQTYLVEILGEKYIVKTDYYSHHRAHHLYKYLKRPRIIREWNNAVLLEKLGINAQKNLALFQFEGKNFLLVKYTDAINGRELREKNSFRKEKYGQKLSQVMSRLHKGRIIHGDLHVGNIFFPSKGNPILIDLETLSIFPKYCLFYENYRAKELLRLFKPNRKSSWCSEDVNNVVDSILLNQKAIQT